MILRFEKPGAFVCLTDRIKNKKKVNKYIFKWTQHEINKRNKSDRSLCVPVFRVDKLIATLLNIVFLVVVGN